MTVMTDSQAEKPRHFAAGMLDQTQAYMLTSSIS